MASFKGQYQHSVDNKGRVSLPAKLRKNLNPEAQESFTIIRGLEQCLYIYPQDEWEKVEEKLANVNSFSKEGRTVKRTILRYAEDLTLDNQNRISLSSSNRDFTGIDGQAVFIGSGERIEVWSPEELEELDAEMSDESYQELFEKVMGDNDTDGQT